MKKINICFFLFCALSIGCSKKSVPKKYIPKVEVQVAITKTIPIGLKAVGHCTAFNSVDIKSQVEGMLEEIHYTEGDPVTNGQLLITIDPKPFQAALEKAIAIRAENVAKLRYSAEVVMRYQSLLPEDYVSRLEFDGFVRDLAEYEATVMQNDADIRIARLNLSYCFLTSPFDGVAGKKLVDRGNLIDVDTPTMVVIKQVNPIYIDFSLPEKDFRSIMKYKKGLESLTVDIQIPDTEKLRKAKLILVDNIIDASTGMVPLRAEISNPDNFFWPGQYVESNLILKEEKDALLIPSKAITTGSKGLYVYVINQDNIAEYKSISTFDIYGSYTHVKGDIKPGDRLVIRGQINIKPNAVCEIVTKGIKK